MSTAPLITPPSTVKGDLLQADMEITTLWNDVFAWERDSDPDGEHFDDVKALGAFYDSWKSYLDTNPSTLWGATYDNVQDWRARAADWYDRVSSWGVELHGVRPTVEDAPSVVPALGLSLGVVVALVVLLIVVKVS